MRASPSFMKISRFMCRPMTQKGRSASTLGSARTLGISIRPASSEMTIDVAMGYFSARQIGVVIRQMNKAARTQPSHCGDRIMRFSGVPS